MGIPKEFTPETVREQSPDSEQLYTDFWRSGEPFKSMLEANPWLMPPDMRKPLEWGTGRYWETTVARKHDYWRDFELPKPTKDIRQMRHDLREWGFCLVEEGLSDAQYARMRGRLRAQAEGERLAGIEQRTPFGQYVNTLVNKGRCFAQCIEQDPEAVQAGPLIEQIVDETLGPGWICHSFLANGADPGGYPQGLHIDQGPLMPWVTVEAPALFNTMYLLDDVDESNGGTLVIPGSHKAMAAAGNGGTIGKLPPAINLEARGGTIMLFDGRLLHGTGANRSSDQRFVATMSNVKPWTRQQENWALSVAPEVLESASPKLLHRMGLQAIVYGGTVEGFGLGARGGVGDRGGAIKQFRSALDAGEYRRVGELDADSPDEDLQRDYTLRHALASARRPRSDP
ncbi:MAG: phytanoyl-CoA dioxygenase family protein [Deltaproteobacteria bacterium]|nr:phytanoyl-CoA dioxygenase family protein [Deltaproteobacteria bacterium]MBW2416059.1 phytanoyl-CoA dioxygenase family protein [Deltaproteobacteria bacterium]